MIIAIERRLEKISSDFLDTRGHTLAAMGHEIITPPIGTLPRHSDLNFTWNHRYGKSLGQSIICELGWLPRTAYQMSWAGINAESHIAPYVWNGAQPEPATRARVNAHRDELQRADDYSHAYMQTRLPIVTGLPGGYRTQQQCTA